MDKMGMEIIQERKQILIHEEANGTKDAAGKDLLTLLIRANIRDKDGMSDEAVLARQFSCAFVRLTRLIDLSGFQKSRPS